ALLLPASVERLVPPALACTFLSLPCLPPLFPVPPNLRSFPTRRSSDLYVERTAEDYGVTPHIRFGHKVVRADWSSAEARWTIERSEEHTSELQSHLNLVCRLLLEKKKRSRQRRRECRKGSGTAGGGVLR